MDNENSTTTNPTPSATVETPGICTTLAVLPSGAHLDASALARILGRCTKSVQRAARRGELPPPIKFMGRHVWMAGAVQEHFAARQAAALQAARKRDQKILADKI